MGSILKSKTCYVGGYADYSKDSWLGFPGSGLSRHHCGIYNMYDSTTRSRAILQVKTVNGSRHLFLTMRAHLFANLNNTSDYPFAIYVSHQYFHLVQHKGSVGIGGITGTSGTTRICTDEMGTTGGGAVRTLHKKKLAFGPVDLGNFENYKNSKKDKKAYLYIAGVGYYHSSSVTSSIDIYPIRLEIESAEEWYDYYPGAICNASENSWMSADRSTGFTKIFSKNSWKDRKNSEDDTTRSTSFIYKDDKFVAKDNIAIQWGKF